MDPEPPARKREEPPPIEFLKPGESQAPAPSEPQAPVAWVPRPEDYERRAPAAPAPPARLPGNRGTFAGVCLFLSALLGFVGIVEVYLIPQTIQDFYNYTNLTQSDLVLNGVLNTLIVWPQVFGVLGGIMAIERKNYRLASVSAFLSTMNFVSPLLLGTLLGVVGLVLLSTARREFTS